MAASETAVCRPTPQREFEALWTTSSEAGQAAGGGQGIDERTITYESSDKIQHDDQNNERTRRV